MHRELLRIRICALQVSLSFTQHHVRDQQLELDDSFWELRIPPCVNDRRLLSSYRLLDVAAVNAVMIYTLYVEMILRSNYDGNDKPDNRGIES